MVEFVYLPVCLRVCVPQKSSCEVQELASLSLTNRKMTNKFTNVHIVLYLLKSLLILLKKRRSSDVEAFYWIPLKRHMAKTMAKS